jgi:HK97 family phage major capsid protein
MTTKLIEKREELRAKQAALAAIFEAAGPELDLGKVDQLKGQNGNTAKAAEVKRLNDELTALGAEVDGLAAVERAAADVKAAGERLTQPVSGMVHPQGGAQAQRSQKSIGEQFVASAAYKGFNGRQSPTTQLDDVDFKTLMTTAAGWAPIPMLMPGYVPHEERIPTVLDIIPVGNTSQAAILYMVESTFTNNAAERTEGANNAGEAALALTATTSTVRQIPVWIPVTKEQMEDVPYISGYVNNRLSLMLRQRLSSEILVGNGAPPNLAGIIGLAGVQTQAKGADPTPDAIYKAMTLVRVTGRAEPNATVWHPNDWQDIRLLRTADGVYIWGSPSEAGPERIWGLRVIQDSACTENTAVVGDYANFCELVMRQGIEIEISDSHAGLFIQYTLAIRASVRAAFIVYRPTAFCQVTGI